MQHKVLEIFRSRTLQNTFFILLNQGLKKVSTKLYDRICKGYVYKNDYIKITSEDENSYIEFTVIDEPIYDNKEYNFEYTKYIYGDNKLCPFLTDILPYYTDEVNEDCVSKIEGQIVCKTRINDKKSKFYFFYIIKKENKLIKAMMWKENYKYSCFSVGDIVSIEVARKTKGCFDLEHIEINEFSEMAYFDIEEIHINKMSRKKNTKNNLEIISSCNLFFNVTGFIKYKSVLIRHKYDTYREYYLLDVDDKKIVLFYNSDLQFYDIEAGNIINITNLRKVIRYGFTFYVSSIFTQFEYECILEMDEYCSSFLYENNIKRERDDCEYNVKRVKQENHEIKLENEKNKITEIKLESEKNKFLQEVNDDLEITCDDISQILDDDPPIINLEVSIKKNNTTTTSSNYIEGGFGYLPDYIKINDCLEYEHLEKYKSKIYKIKPFFVPKKINLKDLEEICNDLVINEGCKYIFEGIVTNIESLSENYCISYIDTGHVCNQSPIKVIVDNEFELYIFGNFFTGETPDDIINKFCEDKSQIIGKNCMIVLQVFRATINHVVYAISCMNKKE